MTDRNVETLREMLRLSEEPLVWTVEDNRAPGAPDISIYGDDIDDAITTLQSQVSQLTRDCAFLLACIDNCSEAGGPCGEMDPEDCSVVHDIRATLSNTAGGE